jgi:plastocyanin
VALLAACGGSSKAIETAAPPQAPTAAPTTASAAGSGSGNYGGGDYGNVTTANTVPPAATNTNGVTIANFAFAPTSITVAPGQVVTWTNKDSTTHTVTEDKGAWDSKDLAVGGTFKHTFDQAGTFTYHCAIHSSMHGTVVVKG